MKYVLENIGVSERIVQLGGTVSISEDVALMRKEKLNVGSLGKLNQEHSVPSSVRLIIPDTSAKKLKKEKQPSAIQGSASEDITGSRTR